MAVHLSIILLFTGLTGFHSKTTISKMSVKDGGSIFIPCLYDSEYTHHVKYLCKGYYWISCFNVIATNKPSSSGKFSISDDTDQTIFKVTINNLTLDDSYYWCVVEIKNTTDVWDYFNLMVTTGSPQLYVDHQEITGFIGDDISINCHYNISGENQWCRLGGSCVKTVSGSIDGTRVTINFNVPRVFTVTMRGLRTENSGWYLCVKGDLQMPVHLTVSHGNSTNSSAPPPSLSIHLKSFIIRLSLLLFIVIVALFTWFIFRRSNQTKAQSSAGAEEEVTFSKYVKHEGNFRPGITRDHMQGS